MTTIKRALVLPDMQIRAPRLGDPEGEWTPALEAVAAYAEDNAPWDYVVQLGDFLDLPYFSGHKDASVYTEAQALEAFEEDKARGAKWLDRFGALTDNRYLIEGNHDFRGTARSPWMKKRPHLAPLVRMGRYARDNGWRWVPYWSRNETVRIGKAVFGHGRYANKYHAEKHARIYLGMNFFYGHVHDVQSYAPVVWEPGVTPVAQSLGCLCNLDQPWLNDPHNWIHCFAEFHFFENGNFTFYPIRLYGDKFVSPDGAWVYEGHR